MSIITKDQTEENVKMLLFCFKTKLFHLNSLILKQEIHYLNRWQMFSDKEEEMCISDMFEVPIYLWHADGTFSPKRISNIFV